MFKSNQEFEAVFRPQKPCQQLYIKKNQDIQTTGHFLPGESAASQTEGNVA